MEGLISQVRNWWGQKPAKDDNQEQHEEESATLTLTFPHGFSKTNKYYFNNQESNTDLDFVIKGMEKPLKLHKSIISKYSGLVDELLKTNRITKTTEKDQIEWMFDTDNEVDRDDL